MTYVAFVSSGAPVDQFLTYSFSAGGGSLEISSSGSLQKFDTNLGTLTAATLTIGGSISGTITLVLGASGTPRSCRGIETSDFYYGSSISALNTILDNSGTPLLSMSASTGIVLLNPSTTNPFSVSDTQSTAPAISGILASLSAAGGGSFSITCDSFSGLSTSGGGGFLSASQSFTGNFSASITYTYH